MNVGKFMIYTSLGALTWNVILAALGWWLGQVVSREELYAKVEEYNSYLTYAGIALGVVCVGIIAYNALKRHK